QDIGRLGKQLGQQQAVGFATRQRLDRLTSSLRGEQEILQVAHHMAVSPTDHDPVTPLGHVVVDILLQLQAGTQLIEVSDLQLGAETNFSFTRFQFSQQNLEQRRLAGAITTNQANTITSLNLDAEITNHRR